MTAGPGKKCWSCGADIAFEMKECPKCGEEQVRGEQASKPEAKWVCPYCKKELPRAEKDAHVCREMSDARMAKARDNLGAPKRRRDRAFQVLMVCGLVLFLWLLAAPFHWGKDFKSFLMGLLILIALYQTFGGLAKKIPGASPPVILFYCLNVILLALAAVVFASRPGLPRALVGVWFINGQLLHYLGKRKFALLVTQLAVLAVAIALGVYFFRAEAIAKWQAVVGVVWEAGPEQP